MSSRHYVACDYTTLASSWGITLSSEARGSHLRIIPARANSVLEASIATEPPRAPPSRPYAVFVRHIRDIVC